MGPVQTDPIGRWGGGGGVRLDAIMGSYSDPIMGSTLRTSLSDSEVCSMIQSQGQSRDPEI